MLFKDTKSGVERCFFFFLQRLHKICLGLYIAFFCKEAIAFQIALSAAGVRIMRLPLSEKRKKKHKEVTKWLHQLLGNVFVVPQNETLTFGHRWVCASIHI